MKLSDVIETEIIDSGMNGEGIARIDNRVVFIPYTLKGERVRAVVKSLKPKYATASVIKVITPSPNRVKPDCPHYYKCGGCDMGHVTPEYRKTALLNELKNNLKKIANIDHVPCEFIRSATATAVRNKLSMPFGYIGGKVVLGLYRQNTHVVEPVKCMLSGSLSETIAQTVCDFANANKLSVYNENTGRGLLRHLVVREVTTEDPPYRRASATLVINGKSLIAEKELGALLPNNVDLFVSENTKRNNVIMGESVRLISGEPKMRVNVMGVKAELSPLSFFQVNDEMRDELYKCAMSHIDAPTLIDLYSGIGITSNLAARVCDGVTAVECIPQAVADADRTAALNGNSHKITNLCANVEDVLPSIVENSGGDADVLVDPPRKGCGADVMRAIAKAKPKKLIYISCNHATMCRDIKVLADSADCGYGLTDCKIFDMFPNTHHVETLAVFEKKACSRTNVIAKSNEKISNYY